MVGCSASGGARARHAGLARLSGTKAGMATLIGCHGGVQRSDGVGLVELGGHGTGARVGGNWNDGDLAWLGDYCLWVDGKGRLRIKRGKPTTDEDGTTVGT